MSLATAAPAQGSHTIPTLAEPSECEPGTGNATPRAADGEEKKKKRSLFGFGKKKSQEPTKPPPKPSPSSKSAPTAATRTTTASPIQTDPARYSPSSPGRPGFASSPRLASPAGSQIFERDVQESAAAILPSSPAIPSHIQTENYIPPVLDASSEAITDDHLNPDTVEIITHTSHQPASVAVAGGLTPHPHNEPHPHPHQQPSWADELAAFAAHRTPATLSNANTDTASNYGSFDTTDVRRLSFISFADVVQAEQQQQQQQAVVGGSRDSMHLAGLTSLAALNSHVRSPSPIRSPVSSAGGGGGAGGTSPPTSKSGSVKGLEMSPGRKPLGSPTSMISMQLGGGGGSLSGGGSPVVSGEIAIETMSQALRRTGSGDLGAGQGRGVGSWPASPI
ncbi:hypothetical protein N657DRAFT_653580 [Parathielavia appendiculata]|uniref:Uncharacterized protein n=1 Tax=Parathielavia appendiculata TaxID=2587402 RepID=A0AAN6Z6V4_9PEZI|nr:hypothetical protein N657DRAFT_653580 [Parathielavia appendiculata]